MGESNVSRVPDPFLDPAAEEELERRNWGRGQRAKLDPNRPLSPDRPRAAWLEWAKITHLGDTPDIHRC